MCARRIGFGLMIALCAPFLVQLGAAAQQTPSSPEPPRLRCWQEGQLIFERLGWRALSVRTSDAESFRSEGDSGPALVLFKVGQATCLLEEH